MLNLLKEVTRKITYYVHKKSLLIKLIPIYFDVENKKLGVTFNKISKSEIHGEKLPDFYIEKPAQRKLVNLFLDENLVVTSVYEHGVFVVSNAKISIPGGIVRIKNGIAPELTGGDAWFLRNPRYIISFFKTYGLKARLKQGLLLGLPFDNNYYHWLIETLPRLYIIEKFGVSLSSLDLLMPSTKKKPNFVWDCLKVVGWGERIKILEDGAYHVHNLIVPSLSAPPGKISEEAVDWLRSKFLGLENSVHVLATKRYERIYVARDDASVRRVINNADVDDLMYQFGFHKVTMENKSVAEQAQIFSSAKLIVGIHGAALANVVFCQKNATLLEIFMDGWFTKAFFNLSRIRGMKYGCYLSKNVNNNLLVDVAELKLMMLKICQ